MKFYAVYREDGQGHWIPVVLPKQGHITDDFALAESAARREARAGRTNPRRAIVVELPVLLTVGFEEPEGAKPEETVAVGEG